MEAVLLFLIQGGQSGNGIFLPNICCKSHIFIACLKLLLFHSCSYSKWNARYRAHCWSSARLHCSSKKESNFCNFSMVQLGSGHMLYNSLNQIEFKVKGFQCCGIDKNFVTLAVNPYSILLADCLAAHVGWIMKEAWFDKQYLLWVVCKRRDVCP